jgi:L-lactate permease
VIASVLDKLLGIPQHHYLVADDFAWCFCFSFEGDMGFGYRPEVKNIAM